MHVGVFVLAFASLFAAGAAGAQLPQFAVPGMPRDYQELMTAMAAAQAKAIRPGDQALGCPALEKELVATMNDPAIQAYAAKAGALAQKQAATAEKAQAATSAQAAAALAAALGVGLPGAGGVSAADAIPGGGLLGQPTLAAQQALVAQAIQDQAAQMKLMLPILPQMMRSQQLMALAFGKQCTWIMGTTPFVPLATPLRKEGLR